MYLDDDDDDDEESNNYSYHRDPCIQHLEQRDTVPNIELYSVLFHNIPALPSCGLEGALLRVNLDSIILIRFHGALTIHSVY